MGGDTVIKGRTYATARVQTCNVGAGTTRQWFAASDTHSPNPVSVMKGTGQGFANVDNHSVNRMEKKHREGFQALIPNARIPLEYFPQWCDHQSVPRGKLTTTWDGAFG